MTNLASFSILEVLFLKTFKVDCHLNKSLIGSCNRVGKTWLDPGLKQ